MPLSPRRYDRTARDADLSCQRDLPAFAAASKEGRQMRLSDFFGLCARTGTAGVLAATFAAQSAQAA